MFPCPWRAAAAHRLAGDRVREHGVHTAIILAAGSGRRMGHLTVDRPKCLLEVGGRTLVERQLANLAACGIRDVTIVSGHQGARLRAHLGDRVRYVKNARHRETNSLYSLYLVRHLLADGAIVLNGDVLAPARFVERLVGSRAEDAVLIDRRKELGPEEMKVSLRGDLVVDFGKELRPECSDGENVGIVKLGVEGGRRLIRHLEALVAAGYERAWAPEALRRLAREWPLRAVLTEGMPWIEIDYPEDLDRARSTIEPAIRTFDRPRAA